MKVGFVAVLADSRMGGPGSADRWETIRERALRAEEAGYDSVWVYDHLMYRPDDLDWTSVALPTAPSHKSLHVAGLDGPCREPELSLGVPHSDAERKQL